MAISVALLYKINSDLVVLLYKINSDLFVHFTLEIVGKSVFFLRVKGLSV